MRFTPVFIFLTLLLVSACKPTVDNDKNGTKVNTSEEVKPITPLTSCYLLMYEKDINAFQITTHSDNSVEGYIAWEPFEKDGGRGFFSGKKEGELISGNFTYMIEGATQTEEVVFKTTANGISKGRGPLDDNGDRFVIIDKASLVFDEVYESVDCSKISNSIENAKAVTTIIKSKRSARYESLTGTYSYDLGNDKGVGILKVKQLENDRLRISFNIVMHGPTFNQGSGEGIITLNENLEGIYFVDEFGGVCEIRFSFTGKKVISKQVTGDFMDCGFGHNVFSDQEFTKTDSTDPFLKTE